MLDKRLLDEMVIVTRIGDAARPEDEGKVKAMWFRSIDDIPKDTLKNWKKDFSIIIDDEVPTMIKNKVAKVALPSQKHGNFPWQNDAVWVNNKVYYDVQSACDVGGYDHGALIKYMNNNHCYFDHRYGKDVWCCPLRRMTYNRQGAYYCDLSFY